MTTKAIYPIRDRWSTFKPFLDHPDVVQALTEGMGYSETSEWVPDDDPPWARTTSDHWMTEIENRMSNDPDYIAEWDALFTEYRAEHAEMTEEEAFQAFIGSEVAEALDERYQAKHEPKKGELKWYWWKHACHFVVDFVDALVQRVELDADEYGTVTTEKHSVAYFVKDGVMYFVDLLNEWGSVQELETFMGGPVDVLPAEDDGAYAVPAHIEYMQFIRREDDMYASYIAFGGSNESEAC